MRKPGVRNEADGDFLLFLHSAHATAFRAVQEPLLIFLRPPLLPFLLTSQREWASGDLPPAAYLPLSSSLWDSQGSFRFVLLSRVSVTVPGGSLSLFLSLIT